MNTSGPLWILYLVPDLRFGRALSALAIITVLLVVYASTGVFGAAPPAGVSPHVAIFFSVILAYIVPTYHYIVARSEEAFDELRPLLNVTEGDATQLRARIRTCAKRTQINVVGIGFAAGLAHNLVLTGKTGLAAAFTSSAASTALTLGTFLVWMVMTAAILGLVDIARLFASLARRVRIDLLQPLMLRPFARVAVISTLAMVGAEAAFPILSLDGPKLFPLTTLPGLAAVFVSMVLLFALPLLPIRRAIAAAKRTEMTRIGERISDVEAHARSDEVRIARLAPLLTFRHAIEQASEWPFDTGTAGRLAFYLIIPPFTWVAAAVIQHVVDVAL
jgi:hypothetical protein